VKNLKQKMMQPMKIIQNNLKKDNLLRKIKDQKESLKLKERSVIIYDVIIFINDK
jgi:hypothetical protein